MRLREIDFIRAICAIGIIIFHYSCSSVSDFRVLYTFASGDWGGVFVTVFFAISGAVLYYNYQEILSIKKFYYRRLKSILPMYYVVFAYYYLESVFASGQVFFRGRPWKLIDTILGMDGYWAYRSSNYYMIGEWFLGAIILLYLLYPCLLWIIKKSEVITTIIVLAFYIWEMHTNIFMIDSFRNLFSCIISFYIGIMVFRYRSFFLENKAVFFVSLIICILLYFKWIPIKINGNYADHIMGIGLFVILYSIGRLIMQHKVPDKLFSGLSRISYPMFLVHHQLIYKILNVNNPTEPLGVIIMIVVTVLLSIVSAKVVSVVTLAILNTKWYLYLENAILKSEKV